MSKRDAIIISVLVNAGLLAILFVTAVRTDNGPYSLDTDLAKSFSENPIDAVQQNNEIAEAPMIANSLDEVDSVLHDYLPEMSKPSPKPNLDISAKPPRDESPKVKYTEVTVKRGDALEKIARANRTTVDAIKQANHLNNDKLKVGQVLRIPQPVKGEAKKTQMSVLTAENEYYVIKSGDNPWKIAKHFNVKFDDLLKLNQLDEETARNLKIGDRIRVK